MLSHAKQEVRRYTCSSARDAAGAASAQSTRARSRNG
ncbi:hypothetical protein [Leifsonia sp. 2MCAF36]